MNINKLLFSLLTILWVGQAFCQSTPPTNSSASTGSLSSGTIDSQFDHLISISRSQSVVLIVRRANLDLIRKNVADSLAAYRQQLTDMSAAIKHEQDEITTLSDSLSLTESKMQTALENRDSFSFFGLQIRKTSYSLLVWGIALILVVILIFYIYRFNRSHIVTKEARKAFDELQAEFDQHRKKALEKEQKLKRQLQDEINRKSG